MRMQHTLTVVTPRQQSHPFPAQFPIPLRRGTRCFEWFQRQPLRPASVRHPTTSNPILNTGNVEGSSTKFQGPTKSAGARAAGTGSSKESALKVYAASESAVDRAISSLGIEVPLGAVIKVIGVGGGGSNAVNRMVEVRRPNLWQL